jgi:hypothetical protein
VLVAGIEPAEDLPLSSVRASGEQRVRVWRERLASIPSASVAAEEMYAGDHWSVVLEACRFARKYSRRIELWVISAGYGLIPSTRMIKPYSATFASGGSDSVWRGRGDGARVDFLQNWWRGLDHERSLEGLLSGRDDAVLIAAGAEYLTAISHRLEFLRASSAKSEESLSVISAGTSGNEILLPVSGSLRATLGGTDSSLNARTLRFLAATANEHDFRHSQMERLLKRLARSSEPTLRRHGRAATDEEIDDFVRSLRRREPEVSRTKALRVLRASGIACEQGRFRAAWETHALRMQARQRAA